MAGVLLLSPIHDWIFEHGDVVRDCDYYSIYQGGAVTNITIGGTANGGAGGVNQVHLIFYFRHKV